MEGWVTIWKVRVRAMWVTIWYLNTNYLTRAPIHKILDKSLLFD